MAYTYGSVTNCKVRNGQTRTEYQCRLGYEVQSQSVANNTSTVKLRLECRSISSSYTTKGSSGLTSVIDGTTVKSNASVDMSNTNTWQNFGERTITITHNADGSCSVSKSGSFTCTAGSSNYSLASGSASVTVKPATIPRASTPTLSVSSVAMGSSVTIYTNRASSSFTHTITYKFGSASGTIASSVGTSTTWTPAVSLANQIPNSTSGTGTITCQTYNGSTLIGTKSVSITLTVPSSVIPSISSIALSAGNSVVPSSWGVYVQGKSSLKVVTTASGSYGSSIKTYKITGIDNNTYWSSNFTSGTLQIAGTRTITVTVTDSRGRTATKTTTYTCVAYSNPSISYASLIRCNADGSENEEGTTFKYSFKASISPINNKNTCYYQFGYKKSNDSSYTYIPLTLIDYNLNVIDWVQKSITLDTDSSYDFQFVATDYFTSVSLSRNIPTGFTLMDFRATGKGMAVGKVSEKDGFELGIPTYYNSNSLPQKTLQYICGIDAFLDGGQMGWQNINEVSVKSAQEDGNGRNIAEGYSRAGSANDINLDTVSSGILNKSGLYTIYDGSQWWNLINIRHRNGVTDGVNYGMQIRNTLTSSTSSLQLRQQTNGTWGSWRRLLEAPVVAYSNSSGTSGTVTLSQSSANYTHIRISYKNDDGQLGSTTFSGVSNVQGTTYGTIVRATSTENTIMANSALFLISGTTITINRNIQGNFVFGGSIEKNGNKLYITKVEMWN